MMKNLPSDEKVDEFIETEVSSSEIPQSADLPNANSINFEEQLKESVNLQEKNELNLGKNEVSKPEMLTGWRIFFTGNNRFSYGVLFPQEHESNSLDSHLEPDDSSNGFFSINPKDVETVKEKESENLIPKEIDDEYIEFELK
ncbi:hypothetical protein L2E82_06080 [Cichorium intybus]|uniref:Uncharacterized protein n=1 Tax=Cichorium intybus TaxID=13427 RepID=A0ACB9HB90_CICIN|nr:hypothetical protein L2E82_06080 [Cichorium intybus]